MMRGQPSSTKIATPVVAHEKTPVLIASSTFKSRSISGLSSHKASLFFLAKYEDIFLLVVYGTSPLLFESDEDMGLRPTNPRRDHQQVSGFSSIVM